MNASERRGAEWARTVDRYVTVDDPTDSEIDERIAFYEAKADREIRVMADPAADLDRRALAEDSATEALYRAMSLRHTGRFTRATHRS